MLPMDQLADAYIAHHENFSALLKANEDATTESMIPKYVEYLKTCAEYEHQFVYHYRQLHKQSVENRIALAKDSLVWGIFGEQAMDTYVGAITQNAELAVTIQRMVERVERTEANLAKLLKEI